MDPNGDRRGIRWYEVAYVVVLLAVLLLGVFFMNPHRVAVLDVDRVFKDLGMVQRLDQDRQKLDVYQRGVAMVDAYNVRMRALKSKLETTKTEVEKEKIQSQMKSATETVQQSVAPIQSQLQARETAVMSTFRRRLQPLIAKVAQKRRVDVVLFASPSVVYVKSTVDLTDDVVAAGKEFFAKKDLPLVDPALTGNPAAPAHK